MPDRDTKFIHLRHTQLDGQVSPVGGVTIAYQANPNGTVHYAVARCSMDDRFTKAQGRAKAAGRLASNNLQLVHHTMDDEQRFFNRVQEMWAGVKVIPVKSPKLVSRRAKDEHETLTRMSYAVGAALKNALEC